MAKALLFTDSHIHDHKSKVERLIDCLEVLKWVFDVADQQGAEYVFFLGDLLQERAKIDLLSYMVTCEVFMERMISQKAKYKVYLLVGNHDMYHKHKWKVNSIKPLTAIPNVFIVDSPQSLQVGNTQIDWLPHTENPGGELAKFTKHNGPQVLLSHIAVQGAALNTFYGIKSDVIVEHDSEMQPVDGTSFGTWDAVFLGHYHGAQQINDRVEYIGSPLQLSFGEAFQQKHIVLLDTDTLAKEYIVNTFSPKHYIITPDDIDNDTYDLNGQFVRVVVDPTISKVDLVDIGKRANAKWKTASFDIKMKDRKPEEDKMVIEDAKEIMANEQDMFEAWMKAEGVPPNCEDKRLKKIGMEICNKLKT